MDDVIDLLRIKIEKAKRELPLETVNAIDAIDWKMAILELREKKGYTFEQIGDLELETELLLCGLTNIEKYPKELENRMKISKSAAIELVNEMNNLVFKKIREELIKNSERKKAFAKIKENEKENNAIFNSAGIEIVPEEQKPAGLEKITEDRTNILEKIENPEPVHPILTQKLSDTVQIATVKTDHTLNNMTPGGAPKNTTSKIDPYREIPE